MAAPARRRRVGRYRAAMTAAIEAIEDGNIFEATAILRAVLEEGPSRSERPHSCPHCPGLSFEWPGLLQHHLDVAHPDLEELAA